MKIKLFAFALSALLCLSLAACQPPAQDDNKETNETTQNVTEENTTAQPDNNEETTYPIDDPAMDDPFNDMLK